MYSLGSETIFSQGRAEPKSRVSTRWPIVHLPLDVCVHSWAETWAGDENNNQVFYLSVKLGRSRYKRDEYDRNTQQLTLTKRGWSDDCIRWRPKGAIIWFSRKKTGREPAAENTWSAAPSQQQRNWSHDCFSLSAEKSLLLAETPSPDSQTQPGCQVRR